MTMEQFSTLMYGIGACFWIWSTWRNTVHFNQLNKAWDACRKHREHLEEVSDMLHERDIALGNWADRRLCPTCREGMVKELEAAGYPVVGKNGA